MPKLEVQKQLLEEFQQLIKLDDSLQLTAPSKRLLELRVDSAKLSAMNLSPFARIKTPIGLARVIGFGPDEEGLTQLWILGDKKSGITFFRNFSELYQEGRITSAEEDFLVSEVLKSAFLTKSRCLLEKHQSQTEFPSVFFKTNAGSRVLIDIDPDQMKAYGCPLFGRIKTTNGLARVIGLDQAIPLNLWILRDGDQHISCDNGKSVIIDEDYLNVVATHHLVDEIMQKALTQELLNDEHFRLIKKDPDRFITHAQKLCDLYFKNFYGPEQKESSIEIDDYIGTHNFDVFIEKLFIILLMLPRSSRGYSELCLCLADYIYSQTHENQDHTYYALLLCYLSELDQANHLKKLIIHSRFYTEENYSIAQAYTDLSKGFITFINNIKTKPSAHFEFVEAYFKNECIFFQLIENYRENDNNSIKTLIEFFLTVLKNDHNYPFLRKSIENFIQNKSGFGEVKYALATFYYDRNDYENASQWLNQAEREKASPIDVKILRARILYSSSQVKGNRIKALEILFELALEGNELAFKELSSKTDLDAQLYLGKLYLTTQFYDRDKAISALSLSADGQEYLGWLYIHGEKGIKQNEEEGVRLLILANKNKCVLPALFEFARQYSLNDAEKVKISRVQFSLGKAYVNRKLAHADSKKEGMGWLRMAAENGHAHACLGLANLLEGSASSTVDADKYEAAIYIDRAIQFGLPIETGIETLLKFAENQNLEALNVLTKYYPQQKKDLSDSVLNILNHLIETYAENVLRDFKIYVTVFHLSNDQAVELCMRAAKNKNNAEYVQMAMEYGFPIQDGLKIIEGYVQKGNWEALHVFQMHPRSDKKKAFQFLTNYFVDDPDAFFDYFDKFAVNLTYQELLQLVDLISSMRVPNFLAYLSKAIKHGMQPQHAAPLLLKYAEEGNYAALNTLQGIADKFNEPLKITTILCNLTKVDSQRVTDNINTYAKLFKLSPPLVVEVLTSAAKNKNKQAIELLLTDYKKFTEASMAILFAYFSDLDKIDFLVRHCQLDKSTYYLSYKLISGSEIMDIAKRSVECATLLISSPLSNRISDSQKIELYKLHADNLDFTTEFNKHFKVKDLLPSTVTSSIFLSDKIKDEKIKDKIKQECFDTFKSIFNDWMTQTTKDLTLENRRVMGSLFTLSDSSLIISKIRKLGKYQKDLLTIHNFSALESFIDEMLSDTEITAHQKKSFDFGQQTTIEKDLNEFKKMINDPTFKVENNQIMVMLPDLKRQIKN